MGELGCVNLHVASAYLKEVVVQLCWDGKEQDSKPQRGLFRRLASLPAMLPRHLLGIFSSHPTSWTFPGEIPASRVLTELPLHVPTQGSLLLLRRLDFMPAINKEFFLQPGLSNHFLLCGAFCEMCLTALHLGFPLTCSSDFRGAESASHLPRRVKDTAGRRLNTTAASIRGREMSTRNSGYHRGGPGVGEGNMRQRYG